MRRFSRRMNCVGCLALLTTALLCGCASSTTIILVRHAEKAQSPPNDPPLTAAGQQRAQALATDLAEAGVEAVFTSEFELTRQTAAPLATARGITPRIIAIGTGTAQQNADDVSEAILASHRGQTVLIVGHSNTIPLIIQRLGVATVVAIPENDFDNLFVVTVPARGPARLVRVQYGAPSP
jgi:broad specificity phosphatase PhoE